MTKKEILKRINDLIGGVNDGEYNNIKELQTELLILKWDADGVV